MTGEPAFYPFQYKHLSILLCSELLTFSFLIALPILISYFDNLFICNAPESLICNSTF